MSPVDLISIVVTTYNRSDALASVLRGLSLQDDRHFEVVIADDGSSQAHQDALEKTALSLGLTLTHVWHPDVGFTASCVRNRGVANAKGSYIVFLDGDCVPEVDFVRQHRRLMQPDCFVNGSRVMLSSMLTSTVVADNAALGGRSVAYWLGKWMAGHVSKLTGLLRLPDGAFRLKRSFVWKGIRSCNMGVWRKHYEAVNGFDESFVGWGHEDADFVLRLHNLGVLRKNGFCATEVYHLWHPESSRAHASVNAQKVSDRMQAGTVMPTTGYRESASGPDVVVRTLG